MPNLHNSIWWGSPKKFSTQIAERKITWLELFYDLVYVIVISKVTHYLAGHATLTGLIDYTCIFAMTFWGWFNGSQYYDLHGSPGVRTCFMMLWQMMAAGALAVTLDSPDENLLYRTTFALLFLQIYITYLWWSVGIYDKEHRRMNRPYTLLYLTAFGLLILSLFIPVPYKRGIFWIGLFLNYLPFTLSALRLRKSDRDMDFSASMTERLGLLTIILLGEAILGVINSVSHLETLNLQIWMCFGMGIVIVFALFWIFFAVIADKECKKGMWVGNMMTLSYIPMLASLGLVGATFPALMKTVEMEPAPVTPLQLLYGASIAVFLCCVTSISSFLVYMEDHEKQKKRFQQFLVAMGLVNLLLLFLLTVVTLIYYLICVFITLLLVVIGLIRSWFKTELRQRAGTDNY